MADRTKKSLKNAQVSMFYYFVQLILGFWSRKIFFQYLGSEILGLDTTAENLLGFLNLAELGVGVSVAYFLYKPLYDRDTMTINEIVAIQGWIYRRIAFVIMGAAAILMFFFPLIFAKSTLPLWCPYATFSVMLFGSMLSYFINYKQIVLSADQKGYKVTVATQGASVFFKVLLILLLPVVPHPFLFYLSTTFAGKLFGCFWLQYVLRKEYPWLQVPVKKGKELLKQYPGVLQKTKQVFIHRMAGVVLLQVSPLIMYAFTSLTVIAFYGNYVILNGKITQLLGTVFSSTGAGIGNLIASKNKERIHNVFWELFDSRLFMSWTMLFCLYFLTEPFITVWLGKEYLLSHSLLVLVIISSSIAINRMTVDAFISGYGLFQDIWAPVVEAIINLGASFAFGYFFGIEGVLMGTILSQSLIIGLWKPYFLFSKGMGKSPMPYFMMLLGRIMLLVVCWLILNYTISFLPLDAISNYFDFAYYAIIVSAESLILLFVSFYVCTAGMKGFVKRIWGIIYNK